MQNAVTVIYWSSCYEGLNHFLGGEPLNAVEYIWTKQLIMIDKSLVEV